MREKDEEWFARAFAPYPQLHWKNARLEPVDWAEVAGLLLTGGSDISGPYLHQPIPHPEHIQEADPPRDAWEFSAVAETLRRHLPVFAICRGLQVLNVALGGTLHLDIPGHDAFRSENVQPLRYAPGASPQLTLVNSSHHQAIDQLGEGLVAEAWHAEDNIIEQIRLSNYPYALGVQFHPERDPLYRPLFDSFVEALHPSP
jgi:putative glutamine amidotransferase